jgi:2OG-Fe(II) oxygenase superfamily
VPRNALLAADGGIVTRAYAVIDDFLPHQDHLDLWDAFRETALSPNDAGAWNRAYQLTDGEAPVSSAFQRSKLSLQDGTAGSSPAQPLLRALCEKLSALMTTSQPPIAIEPWTGFSVSAWAYHPGMGLEWHCDTGWLGGFIYYVHPVWRTSWGGELLVAADDNSSAGAFIYPQPNRLVLLRGGTRHCIKKVESAAGQAYRASVSGFFFNAGNASD